MSTWVYIGTIPGSGSGGAANVLGKETIGIIQSVVADFGRFPQAVGVSVAEAPKRVTSPQTVGVSQSYLSSGTPARVALSPGVSVSSIASGGTTSPQTVGAELVQIKYDLTQTTYATSVVGTGTWTNPNNAVGANNGVFATNANTLTAAASGTIALSYAAQQNKTELTISSVIASFYAKYTAGLVTPGTWSLAYSTDGTNYTPSGFAGSATFDQSAAPLTFDMTSIIGGDWNKLTNLKFRYTFAAAASATPSTFSLDAVKVVVQASKTDLL